MKKVLSALLAAAMILFSRSLQQRRHDHILIVFKHRYLGQQHRKQHGFQRIRSHRGRPDPHRRKAGAEDPSMYQAYNYEEQPTWKIDEELTGYKTKWYALPADNADQKLWLRSPAAQTTTSCSEFLQASTHSSLSRTH